MLLFLAMKNILSLLLMTSHYAYIYLLHGKSQAIDIL
jgi:hypothetical protein